MDAFNESLTPSRPDYLSRIAVQLYGMPSLDQLRHLHQRHLQSVPFENLDIHRGVPIVLDEPSILRKIVTHRRGGFCYELNGAFAWLLRQTGFEPQLLSAEVARLDGGFGIPFDHMLLLVPTPKGPHLADVGFGESFFRPLPLVPDQVHEETDFRFRLRRDQDTWTLWRAPQMSLDFAPQYRFTLLPRELADFQPGCDHHQSAPESTFTQGPMVTLARFDGRATLTSKRLIVRRRRERSETPVEDEAQWERLLAEHFRIDLRATVPESSTTDIATTRRSAPLAEASQDSP